MKKITRAERKISEMHTSMLEDAIPSEKAVAEFKRKPYQSYTVSDYLRKMGVRVITNKEVDADGRSKV